MGLLDKYIAKIAGPAPDMPAIMGRLLPAEDDYLAWTNATPEGFTRESGGVGLEWRVIHAVTNQVRTTMAQEKHIGGAPGSIATTLPTDGEMLTLVASRGGLSTWRWLNGAQGDPSLHYRLNVEHLRSITDVTERAGNDRVIRVTFADESFFDYRITMNTEEFLAACQQLTKPA